MWQRHGVITRSQLSDHFVQRRAICEVENLPYIHSKNARPCDKDLSYERIHGGHFRAMQQPKQHRLARACLRRYRSYSCDAVSYSSSLGAGEGG